MCKPVGRGGSFCSRNHFLFRYFATWKERKEEKSLEDFIHNFNIHLDPIYTARQYDRYNVDLVVNAELFKALRRHFFYRILFFSVCSNFLLVIPALYGTWVKKNCLFVFFLFF